MLTLSSPCWWIVLGIRGIGAGLLRPPPAPWYRYRAAPQEAGARLRSAIPENAHLHRRDGIQSPSRVAEQLEHAALDAPSTGRCDKCYYLQSALEDRGGGGRNGSLSAAGLLPSKMRCFDRIGSETLVLIGVCYGVAFRRRLGVNVCACACVCVCMFSFGLGAGRVPTNTPGSVLVAASRGGSKGTVRKLLQCLAVSCVRHAGQNRCFVSRRCIISIDGSSSNDDDVCYWVVRRFSHLFHESTAAGGCASKPLQAGDAACPQPSPNRGCSSF